MPELLAIIGLLISSAIFYRYAREVSQGKLTFDSFIVADSSLQKRQFGNTFAASSVSLATFIMFFFFNSKVYGLFLLISPITYLLGQGLFVWLIKNADINFKECRTLSDLSYKFFPSKTLARLITMMTLSSYLMVVFLELYIGAVVFSIFLPNNIFYQAVSFFAMGILILMYVRLGGYKALVRTDMVQLVLMLMATFLIFAYGITAPIINSNKLSEVMLDAMVCTESSLGLIIFSVWLTLLNFLSPFTQIAQWQRLAARDRKSVV